MMEKVLVADEINVTYSMYDRFIFGGAMPVNKELSLDTIDPLKAPYFCSTVSWVLSTSVATVS